MFNNKIKAVMGSYNYTSRAAAFRKRRMYLWQIFSSSTCQPAKD